MFQPRVGKLYHALWTHMWGDASYVDYPANQLVATYYPVFRKFKADRIVINVRGAGAVGAKIRMGIYDDENWYPKNLLQDFGEVSAEVAGRQYIVIDYTLDVGKYWLVFITNDSTIDLGYMIGYISTWLKDLVLAHCSYYKASTYGALPSTFPTGGGEDVRSWSIAFRVSEVF